MIVRWTALLFLLALLGACESRESRLSKGSALLVVARDPDLVVDPVEVALSGDSVRDQRAMDVVIARKLAAREARLRGIDATDATREKLEALRREANAREEEILRDALFSALRDGASISDADLRAHFEKTRARHTERRIALRRQRFASEADANAAMASLGSEARLDPATTETLLPATAEKLPADVIPEALRLTRVGDRVVIVREGGAALVELVAIEPAAQMTFEEARRDVEESLRTLRAQEAFRAEIARLRAEAGVEVDLDALRRQGRQQSMADEYERDARRPEE